MAVFNEALVVAPARKSKETSGDHPKGNNPGKPCGDRPVSWKGVDALTAPAGTLILTVPAARVPPVASILVEEASGLRRASMGTVPTPDWISPCRSPPFIRPPAPLAPPCTLQHTT